MKYPQVIIDFKKEVNVLSNKHNELIETRAIELFNKIKEHYPLLTGFCSGMGEPTILGCVEYTDPETNERLDFRASELAELYEDALYFEINYLEDNKVIHGDNLESRALVIELLIILHETVDNPLLDTISYAAP